MKKKLFYCPSIFLLSALSACSSDSPDLSTPVQEVDVVSFHLDFPGMADVDTRSLAPGYKYSDGTSISILKCYVYNQENGENAEPVNIMDVPIDRTTGKPTGEITMVLPLGEKYDFVFLGTSIPQTSQSSKLYYSTTERSLAVNYSSVSSNDEELDCFFASAKDISVGSVIDNNIVLTRPFAQINIGTKDYEDYIASTPVRDIAVTVEGIYNKFSLMDGSLIGDPTTVTFAAAAPPTDQTFPVDNVKYLAMNYILVNLRTTVNVSMVVNHVGSISAKTIDIGEVGVERNYQTNIYANKLLTDY